MTFNLSDKIAGCESTGDGYYEPEDVQEFIRRLKEGIYIWFEVGGLPYVLEKIDKLAGSKLLEGGKKDERKNNWFKS